MKYIVLTFLIANAIFWGLFPDEAQCLVIKYINDILMTKMKCPGLYVQAMIGVTFYLLSIYYSKKY